MLYPATGSAELPGGCQVKETCSSAPVPLRFTTASPFGNEVPSMINCPVAAPAVTGSNTTSSVAVWPCVRMRGKLAPDNEKPVPVTVARPIVMGSAPDAVKVTDCVTAVFTGTLPNATFVALMPSPAAPAFSCKVQLAETPPPVATRVAV